jgi:peptide subunit release factor 1 (eRF1)
VRPEFLLSTRSSAGSFSSPLGNYGERHRVLQALEAGKVQSIFLGETYSVRAIECPYCGHLDAHLIASCVACGRLTREPDDVCDAIIPIAIRRNIELFYLKEDEALDHAGSIAALLRFRSDQRTGRSAAAS